MLKINPLQSISLDLIRLLAAQMVLLGHAVSMYGISENTAYIQNSGVVLFFVLSGLIISYTVMMKSVKGNYSFKAFFIERFARIYSGLVPSLLLIAIVDYFLLNSQESGYLYADAYDFRTFLGNLLMFQDFYEVGHVFDRVFPPALHITSFGSGRPLWTLAIEWWLYMAYGMIWFYFMQRFHWKLFPLFMLVAIVPAWNLLYGPSRAHGLSAVWLLGVVVTLLAFRKNNIADSFKLAGSGVFLLFAILIIGFTGDAYSIHFAMFVAAFVLFMLMYQENSTWKNIGVGAYIVKFGAGYSFTLYLIHYTVLELMQYVCTGLDKHSSVLLSVVVANVMAAALALSTEMKHKALAKKLKEMAGIGNVER